MTGCGLRGTGCGVQWNDEFRMTNDELRNPIDFNYVNEPDVYSCGYNDEDEILGLQGECMGH